MKLRLKDILQEGPGRPEGPGPENIHHFPHHGLYGRTGGMKPKFDKFGPYGDPTADIRTGDEVAEETPESEEELPESIEEFFKFTQSASDNTSFPRPPHQGSGFPAAYGKPLNAYGSYDPASNNKINKKRNQTIQGRADQKITKFDGGKEFAKKDLEFPFEDADINEMIAGRERIERDENDYSTKHAYKNGIPGSDKKDIYNSYERIDSFFKSLKREEQNDADNKKLEKQIRDKELEEAANSAYNKIMQRIMHSPQSDLGFFDILKRDNMYTMTDPEREHETEKKPKGFSAGKSKKGK